MTALHDLLHRHVDRGAIPGAVALVGRKNEVEVVAVGDHDVEGSAAMTRDTIFRVASITKMVTAATLMMLIEEGLLDLGDPVREWLPELASPMVVRTPGSEVDDLVPAVRPISVEDLLTSRAGYGFPSDMSSPAVGLLFDDVQQDGREVQRFRAPDDWLAALARIPLVYQPGEAWLYNTSSDLQGLLVARVTGRSFPEVLADRVLEPLGMVDTGFVVPADKRARFASYYRVGDTGRLELADAPDGQWSTEPAFPSGAGGLASTVDDWLAFSRMLLADGITPGGRRLLTVDSVGQMTNDHTTPAQREIGRLFLDGQGWGYGASVDVTPGDPWFVPGRYGWVGGTGTSAHVVPSTGAVAILLTQVAMDSPAPSTLMRDFWTYAAGALRG